jgi:biotin-(acetyl-CoA carboxylase) ligase
MTRPSVTFDLSPGDLSLPPAYRLKTAREVADAFQTALASVSDGAGTLVWARRFHIADFAVVLEPEQPLIEARLAFYAAMSALADALAVYCPPEKPILFDWPDAIKVDGALVGGGRFAWPPGTHDHDIPPWLVFGAKVRVATKPGEEPGNWTLGTSLEDEGFEDLSAAMLIESFSRHLMSVLHDYEEGGPRREIERWLHRLDRKGLHGVLITGEGDLVVREGSTRNTRSLASALAQPSWLDPKTNEPWL